MGTNVSETAVQSKLSLAEVFRECVKPGKRIFIDPQIPSEKIAKATKAFAPVKDSEHIFCLIDTTVFGSAKQGLVITDQGLYWTSLPLALPPGRRPYPEVGIVNAIQTSTLKGLELEDGTIISLAALEWETLKGLAEYVNKANRLFGARGLVIRSISKTVLDNFKPLDISVASMTVSPQNKRFAYIKPVGRSLQGRSLCVDGHDIDGTYDEVKGIVFSPDDRHIAFAARSGTKSFVICDERNSQRYDEIGDRIIFSRDGLHLGYAAKDGKMWAMVIDGNIGKPHIGIGEDSPIFSPDGRRIAYAAVNNEEKMFYVTDDKEGPSYDKLIKGSDIFSPDSQRIAYGASKQGKCLVNVDGREGTPFDAVDRIRFSPDSKHIAYVARLGEEHFLVFDDKIEGKCYRGGIGVDPPVFSPDGKHLAYVAVGEKSWFVILDGQEQEHFEKVADLAFSPDSAHLAYLAKMGGKGSIVVDGIRHGAYEEVGTGSITFSPDSAHYVFMGIRRKGMQKNEVTRFVIVDGRNSEEYGYIFQKVIFDTFDFYHYLALDLNDRIVLIEEKIE